MKSIALCILLLASPVLAEPPSGDQTVVGEVVDTTCFLLHGGRGASHQACAVTCTRAGSPAAILDDKSGRLVYALNPISPHNHHTRRPDERLLPFVGERVKVRGAMFERAGVRAIVVDSVEKAPEAAAR